MSAYSQSSIPNALMNQSQNSLRSHPQFASQHFKIERSDPDTTLAGSYLKYDNNWMMGANRRATQTQSKPALNSYHKHFVNQVEPIGQQSPKKQSSLGAFQQTKSKSFDAATFYSNLADRNIFLF